MITAPNGRAGEGNEAGKGRSVPDEQELHEVHLHLIDTE